MGIEPTLAAWEAAVLPLNYTRAGRFDITELQGFLAIRPCGAVRGRRRVGGHSRPVARSHKCSALTAWQSALAERMRIAEDAASGHESASMQLNSLHGRPCP